MKKKLLILITLIALVMVSGRPLFAGEIKEITLDVQGMTCKLCPKAIKKSISNVNGVKKVDVSYKEKEAHVKYDVGETGVEEIIAAVKKIGYGATLRSKALKKPL